MQDEALYNSCSCCCWDWSMQGFIIIIIIVIHKFLSRNKVVTPEAMAVYVALNQYDMLLWTSGHWLVIKTSQVPRLAVAPSRNDPRQIIHTCLPRHLWFIHKTWHNTDVCISFNLFSRKYLVDKKSVAGQNDDHKAQTESHAASQAVHDATGRESLEDQIHRREHHPASHTHTNHSDQQINVCKKMPSFHELVVWWTRDKRVIFPNWSQYFEFSSLHWQC